MGRSLGTAAPVHRGRPIPAQERLPGHRSVRHGHDGDDAVSRTPRPRGRGVLLHKSQANSVHARMLAIRAGRGVQDLNGIGGVGLFAVFARRKDRGPRQLLAVISERPDQRYQLGHSAGRRCCLLIRTSWRPREAHIESVRRASPSSRSSGAVAGGRSQLGIRLGASSPLPLCLLSGLRWVVPKLGRASRPMAVLKARAAIS